MDVREKLVELLKEVVAIQECGFGDPRPTYETVARYLIANGVTVQEWISVDDELPENGGYVVCIAKRNPFSRFMPMVLVLVVTVWIKWDLQM